MALMYLASDLMQQRSSSVRRTFSREFGHVMKQAIAHARENGCDSAQLNRLLSVWRARHVLPETLLESVGPEQSGGGVVGVASVSAATANTTTAATAADVPNAASGVPDASDVQEAGLLQIDAGAIAASCRKLDKQDLHSASLREKMSGVELLTAVSYDPEAQETDACDLLLRIEEAATLAAELKASLVRGAALRDELIATATTEQEEQMEEAHRTKQQLQKCDSMGKLFDRTVLVQSCDRWQQLVQQHQERKMRAQHEAAEARELLLLRQRQEAEAQAALREEQERAAKTAAMLAKPEDPVDANVTSVWDKTLMQYVTITSERESWRDH